MDDNLIKAGIMLGLVLFEYWAMQPNHKSVEATIWYTFSSICYRIARRFGEIGLSFEHHYYQVI